MADENRKKAVCPKCGMEYSDYPAISRKDNKTPICPDCGIREAFEALGASKEAQDGAVRLIHSVTEDQIKAALKN